MKKSILVLKGLGEKLKKFDGVIFFSIEQLDDKKFLILKDLIKKNKEIHFYYENIKLKSEKDLKNVIFLKNEMKLISSNKSVINDDSNNLYKLDDFEYLLNEKLLKGNNILVITNYLKPKSDSIFFTDGIFDFQNKMHDKFQ